MSPFSFPFFSHQTLSITRHTDQICFMKLHVTTKLDIRNNTCLKGMMCESIRLAVEFLCENFCLKKKYGLFQKKFEKSEKKCYMPSSNINDCMVTVCNSTRRFPYSNILWMIAGRLAMVILVPYKICIGMAFTQIYYCLALTFASCH